MDLNEAERQLLVAARTLEWRDQRSVDPRHAYLDPRRLRRFGKMLFKGKLEDWSQAYTVLIRTGLLRSAEDCIVLTDKGRSHATSLRSQFIGQSFDQILESCENSKAYGYFCEQVYGRSLHQFNLLDMEQLHLLLEVLSLHPESRVLDLGCGIGAITEYLAAQTPAHVIGVDLAEQTIERARVRTWDVRDRLSFFAADMNHLEFPTAHFDALVAVDSLYLVDDLRKLIGSLLNFLRADGQMFLFHTEPVSGSRGYQPGATTETQLARALSAHDLFFDTYDLTLNEYRIWRRRQQALEDLEEDFLREGDSELLATLQAETQQYLELATAKKLQRFLYHTRFTAGGR